MFIIVYFYLITEDLIYLLFRPAVSKMIADSFRRYQHNLLLCFGKSIFATCQTAMR